MKPSLASTRLLILFSTATTIAASLPLSTQAAPAAVSPKVETLQQFMQSGNNSLTLTGDGSHTDYSFLTVKNNDTGKSFSVKLNTYCISTKTKLPPQTAERTESQHIQYTIANQPPVISGIEHASSIMNEEGEYKGTADQHTMTQLAIWEENGTHSSNQADRITPAEIKNDFLKAADIKKSSLTSAETNTLNDRVALMWNKVDRTRKYGEQIAQQDPKTAPQLPGAPGVSELPGMPGLMLASLPPAAVVPPIERIGENPDYVLIPAETAFVPNTARGQTMSNANDVLVAFNDNGTINVNNDRPQPPAKEEKTVTEVQNGDGTKTTTTVIKSPSGQVITQEKTERGKEIISSSTTIDDGKGTVTVITTDDKHNKTTTVTKTDEKGNKITTVTSEDKDHKVTKGDTTVQTPKGTYRETTNDKGKRVVVWNQPDGTGGSTQPLDPKQVVTPNNDDPNNPLPFVVTTPPDPPAVPEGGNGGEQPQDNGGEEQKDPM